MSSQSKSLKELAEPSTPATPLSNEPIRCHVNNCTKTFRKHSLLEYHLKYHHYVSVPSNTSDSSQQLDLSHGLIQQQSQYLSAQNEPAKRGVKRTSRLSTSSNQTLNEPVADDAFALDDQEEEEENAVDPYEVIHCQCGNHTSNGFMIQCEVCLCWQHGDCVNVKTAESVPKHYLCWICKEPGNKLKKLKYQSWMQSGRVAAANVSNSVAAATDGGECLKLRLLNECSRKYYNLNLLMYTLEYQMSLFESLTRDKAMPNTTSGSRETTVLDEEAWSQIEKLGLNVAHLQTCLSKKFDDFNVKITGKNLVILIRN